MFVGSLEMFDPQAPFKYHRVSEFALPGLWHGLERINNGSRYFHRDGPGSFGNVSCMKNLSHSNSQSLEGQRLRGEKTHIFFTRKQLKVCRKTLEM